MTLDELREQMDRLVQRRRLKIQAAEKAIKEANHEFDTRAVPLGKEIARLEKEQTPPPRLAVVKAPDNFTGLTEEEIEHYREIMK